MADDSSASNGNGNLFVGLPVPLRGWNEASLVATHGDVKRPAARTQLTRSVGVMVDIEEANPNRDWIWARLAREDAQPLAGSTEEIAGALLEYHRLGIEHIQV